jgi:hypothetical protein
MAIKVGVYNSKKVTIVLGAHIVVGFNSKKVSIKPITKKKQESESGVDGDVTRSLNHDQRYELEFELKGESPSNAAIRLLSAAGELSFSVLVKNTSGGAYTGGGVEGWVSERPDREFESKSKPIIWKIEVADYNEADL